MPFRGSLDFVSTTGVTGWAYSVQSKAKLVVQAILNNAVIGEAIADQHRPDLAAVGLGDGNCGYAIDFYHAIEPAYLPFIVVKPEGGDVELPRSTISGYSEFFSALYKQHPVAGRHRSVYGGLWTDRIDAQALYKDRLEIGLIGSSVAAALQSFLQGGFTVFSNGNQPAETLGRADGRRSSQAASEMARTKTPDLRDVISTMLESPPVLELLHAVLEGSPLAFSSAPVEGGAEKFRQASAMEMLPSPGECLALVTPLSDEPVTFEIVRGSHLFPEFGPDGQSRWVNTAGIAALDVALQQHGMIESYVLNAGDVAVISPGLIHRVRAESGGGALRVQVTPSRQAPLDRMLDGSRKEIVLPSGAKIWM